MTVIFAEIHCSELDGTVVLLDNTTRSTDVQGILVEKNTLDMHFMFFLQHPGSFFCESPEMSMMTFQDFCKHK